MSGSIRAGSWQRTGEYHTRGVPVLHGLRWQLPLRAEKGVDSDYFFPVSLLQQDGILYVTYFGGHGESACCAIDAQSGTLRWRFTVADRAEDLPDSLREAVTNPFRSLPTRSPLYYLSSMVLTATTAFVGTTYGVVYGLDLRTGQPIWKIDVDELKAQLGETYEGRFMLLEDDYYLDVQAVVGNLLLVSSGPSEIYAIDIAERTCLWHTPGLAGGPLTFGDHMLYGRDLVSQGDGGCIYAAYDWHRQHVAWHSNYGGLEDTDFEGSFLEESKTIPIEILMDGCIPLVGETLYAVGCKGWGSQEEEEEEADDYVQLMALDARTGEIRWTCSPDEFEFGGHRCYVTVANGLVYVSEYGDRCAIDLETHQLRWHHSSQRRHNNMHSSSPVLADGLWYECREDGVLLVLDALTGEEHWTYSFEDPMPPSWLDDNDTQPPCLVDDGSVYVIAGTTLYALH